jgi:hypothetical protein
VTIRIRKRQGELFADGPQAKHFAVVSNVWEWETKRLLEWHRNKAGTIEAVHDVLKNELAAGVLPCSRFGANAAWLIRQKSDQPFLSDGLRLCALGKQAHRRAGPLCALG